MQNHIKQSLQLMQLKTFVHMKLQIAGNVL